MKNKNLLSLENKVAVITGSASGIGEGTARLFAEMNASVALLDINEEKGTKVAAQITDNGGRACFFLCDVTSDKDCKNAVEAVIQEFGKIDILFNNAGIAIRKNIVDLKEAEWDKVANINLKGIYLLSHHAIPHMIKNGGGSIINTGSGWSLRGGADALSYCATKGGVLNMTRAMAIDHGKHNIRVNCICPGDTDTPMLREEARQLGETDERFLTEAAQRPLRRIGRPEDVAQAALYLASDGASFITGTVLVVDGGGLAG